MKTMAEFFVLKLKDNDNVIEGIHNFMRERDIKLAVPVLAYGKIKDFEVLTLGGMRRLVKENSGNGFEVNAISGKVHTDVSGYYTNISVIVSRSGMDSAHGELRNAFVDEFLELKMRKINLKNIIEA